MHVPDGLYGHEDLFHEGIGVHRLNVEARNDSFETAAEVEPQDVLVEAAAAGRVREVLVTRARNHPRDERRQGGLTLNDLIERVDAEVCEGAVVLPVVGRGLVGKRMWGD